jgi:hypothetical protein
MEKIDLRNICIKVFFFLYLSCQALYYNMRKMRLLHYYSCPDVLPFFCPATFYYYYYYHDVLAQV